MELDKLFNPSSVAIVGATEEEKKTGNAICENLLNLGYLGKVFLVNPNHQELFGKKCYPKLEEIKEDVDLAIIAVPAKFVSEVIKNSSNKVKNFIVISAGFSEIGMEGEKREKELLEITKNNNLNVLGPNCLGIIIPGIKLNASFTGGLPKPGNISLVSQSGALISAISDIFRGDYAGFSNIISIGNEMQIDESNLFEYLEKDENTKVIGMYLEGIKNGRKFKELAKKISKVKPVVILKAGKTEKSQKAISSHTGSLTGSENVIHALFKKTGTIEVNNLDEFVNLIKLISLTEAPLNEKMIIITNAGGPGVLTADAFAGKEIKLAELPESRKNELKKILPEESSLENPVDLLGDAQEDRYEKVLEVISKENFGGIICVLTFQENTPIEKITEKIIEFKKKTAKPVFSIFLGGDKVKKSSSTLENSGIPNFSSPEKAIDALDKYYIWNKTKDKKEGESAEEPAKPDRIKNIKNIIEKAKSENRKALFFAEAKKIMEFYGIKTVNFQEVSPRDELVIDFPLVMKVDSDKVLHKTDKQGLVLNIKDEEDFKKAYEKMSGNFPGEKIIIQPMEEIKTELILGIKQDETVGPVVLFGLGGIYTEIFKMVDFVLPPAGISEIKEIILKSPIKFLFKESRGQQKYNLEELSQIILKFSLLSQEMEEIKELDINPLLIYNNGREALAVDIKIII